MPHVEATVMNITSLSSDKIDMTVSSMLINHLPFTFIADSLEFSLRMDSVEVLRTRYEKSVKVTANDTSWVSTPVTLLIDDLNKIIKSNDRRNVDSVAYELETSFYTKFIIRKKINLDIKTFMPLFYLPELTIEKLEIESFNFKNADLIFHVAIDNQNAFPFTVSNVAYKLAIEDNEWVNGKLPGVTELYACGITRFDIPVRLSIKEVSKTLWKLIKKGGNVRYKLRMAFTNESEIKMINKTDVILLSNGSVKSLRKTMKELKK